MARKSILLTLLIAFFLSMIYLAELRQAFPSDFASQPFCGVDAIAHWDRATGFLSGSLPDDKVFYFLPLYPIYLAVFQKFFGNPLVLPIYMQALFQIIGIAALYGVGRLAFSPLTGVLAALGLTTYSYYLFYLPCFDQALLTTPSLTLALFFLLKYQARRQVLYIFGAGVALAIAILSRPTVLMVLLVVIIWLFWYRLSLRQFVQNVVLLVLPVLVAVLPFTWHNYRASGSLVLISNNFGINLFTGNNPDASGLDSLAHVQTQPAVPRFLETIRRVHAGETTFAAEALRYMGEQPLDALKLTLRKSWLWFAETEEPIVEPFFPLKVTQAKTLAYLPIKWQAVVVAGLLGILFARGRSWARLSLIWAVYAVFSLFTILFFIQFRFRLPFIPFVMLSAASLLAMAPRWGLHQPLRFWAVLVVLLLLSPVVPGLNLFALLFAGLGFWSLLKQQRRLLYRWAAAGVGAYLLMVSIWLRADALASAVSQTIDIYLGPPLVASSVLGQTFQMDCDGLSRIDVTLGTFDEQHDQPIVFHLATDTSAQEILFAETFAGDSVRDYQKRTFYFEPIADSAGRTFFFFIASPSSVPDNAITARGYSDTPVDHYPPGSAFAGQIGALQQIQADFAFTAYCDLSLWQKVKRVFRRSSS